jgi:Skp family chaperone for outer membrane proteins
MEGARTQNWLSSALVVLLLAIAVLFFHSQTTAQAHQMSDLEKALLALMKELKEEHSKTEDSLRQTQDNLRQTQEKMKEEHSKTEDSLRQTQDNLRQTQDKMEEEHSKTEDNLRQTQDKMEQSIRRTQEALGKLSRHLGTKRGTNFLSCTSGECVQRRAKRDAIQRGGPEYRETGSCAGE